jgi:cytochrome c peroxidase
MCSDATPLHRLLPGVLVLALLLASCRDESTSPEVPLRAAPATPANPAASAPTLPAEVRALAAARGIGALARPAPVRPALAELGRMLAFDPILSGNRDISCMTCHHPKLATGDARALSIGQGAAGLGRGRAHPRGAFIPRNAPPLFNLHAMRTLFWDGRVSGDRDRGFHTPAGAHLSLEMASVLEFGPISALPLFPVLSREEMRGDVGSPNELAAIPDSDPRAVWGALMARLGAIPEYRRMFEDAYPGQWFEAMTFAHAANAIAAFFLDRLTFVDSPWDRFLAGNDGALTPGQLDGAKDFLSLRCSICHGGPALTDDAFHNVAVAQLGPGQGDGPSGRDDFGRARVTGGLLDRYAFRTPPLRNVELTAPYGHDGAFDRLREFIAHYSESDKKLRAFDGRRLEPLLRPTLLRTADEILATRDTLLNGVVIPEEILDRLTIFMKALTDPAARDLEHLLPRQVPSGLPVARH